MPAAKDESGNRYGRLTVLSRSGTAADGAITWSCRCDCGSTTSVIGRHLRNGNTKSCGCLSSEMVASRNLKHGMASRGSVSPEYHTWAHMIQRCYNEDCDDYDLYGGRGILVHDEWIDSFQSFLDHIGPRPSPSHSIDRIDVNRDYCPGNVRWATSREQARNRRSNRFAKYKGRLYYLADLELFSPVTRKCIAWRLDQGWSVEDAVETPAYKTPKGKSK